MYPNITGLVLCGGQGSRMGGVDKGLQPFRGAPLVRYVLQNLRQHLEHILINANRSIADYAALGHVVIPDNIAGYAGPLAGLQAGLALCDTEYLLSVPCDTPFLPPDLVPRLAAAIAADEADIAVAVCEGQSQPVVAIYRAHLLPSLMTFMATGQRKIDKWTAQHHTVAVEFNDPQHFLNLNTLKELHDES